MTYVNLLPEEYVARRKQRRTNLLCSILFCLVMAGVLGATLVSEQTRRRTRSVNDRVNESYRQAGQLIQQLQSLEATKGQMVGKANLTAELLERVPRSYLLATVTNALPPGGSLLKFDLETQRRSTTIVSGGSSRYSQSGGKTAATDRGQLEVRLVVTGLAATDVEVAKFIAQMAKCPLMESVDLVYSEEKKISGSMVRTFQVEMQLKGDADVRAAAEARELAAAEGKTEGDAR